MLVGYNRPLWTWPFRFECIVMCGEMGIRGTRRGSRWRVGPLQPQEQGMQHGLLRVYHSFIFFYPTITTTRNEFPTLTLTLSPHEWHWLCCRFTSCCTCWRKMEMQTARRRAKARTQIVVVDQARRETGNTTIQEIIKVSIKVIHTPAHYPLWLSNKPCHCHDQHRLLNSKTIKRQAFHPTLRLSCSKWWLKDISVNISGTWWDNHNFMS